MPAILTPERRLNEGVVRQGVTTVLAGPDGGAGPADIRRMIDALMAQGTGTNVATYVGHNAVRRAVMGDEQRATTAEELDRMRGLVREGMDLGAVGLSTGLMYEPGMFSTTDEVVELAKTVRPYRGIYDSNLRADSRSEAPGHPRSTGTFPRVLGHYVREVKLLSLQHAVRKMTSLPADWIGLHDRGRIFEGQAADLVIFDSATIADRSTWSEPGRLAIGVRDLMVNGVLVLRNGEMTGAAPGRYLRARR